MMYDFHSHALFGMDDGAKNKEMAVEMLELSVKQGVSSVLLTPHCYPSSPEDIEEFLIRRERAFDELYNAADLPVLYRGCEVHMTQDLTRFTNIEKLCIENTRYMLLEMPRTVWTDKTIENVYKLNLMDIIPVIAHDERNLHQPAPLHNSLYDLDVLVQINAGAFMSGSLRKTIDKMMKLGMIHVIGTDMHNMSSRRPCMDGARKKIEKRYGEECFLYLMDNAAKILNGEKISYHDFKSFGKKGIFKK